MSRKAEALAALANGPVTANAVAEIIERTPDNVRTIISVLRAEGHLITSTPGRPMTYKYHGHAPSTEIDYAHVVAAFKDIEGGISTEALAKRIRRGRLGTQTALEHVLRKQPVVGFTLRRRGAQWFGTFATSEEPDLRCAHLMQPHHCALCAPPLPDFSKEPA